MAEKKNPKTKPIPVVDQPVVEPVERVPVAPEPAETQPVEVVDEPVVVVVDPPKKKRRRWPFVVAGILLFLVILLVIGYVIGENYAKDYAKDYIKQRIVAVLGIDDPSTVSVDIGTGSVLFQALRGELNQVDVVADSVTFGTLTGAATVHAEGVPLDANAKTDKLEVTFAMPEDQVVSALSGNLSGLQLDSITLEEPEITVTSTINLFFFSLPVGMGIVPSAADGELVFTPTTITLGDKDYTVDELRQEIGSFADPILQQRSLCVNESLPVALTIVDVDVVKKDLVLKINGDGVVLGGTDLSTPGSCAS